jgi:membrane fusion protein, multidrug efflux system
MILRSKLHPVVLLGLLSLAIGCKKSSGPAAGGAPGGMAVQVVAVEARREPVVETLSLVGTLLANEMVEVKSEIEGTVSTIQFDEGQRVEKGQALVQLDESVLAPAVAEAEANFKLSQITYERNKELFGEKLISQQEYDQSHATFFAARATLERRKSELAHTKIVASFSGIVGGRQVSPGQVIGKNTTITWVVDLDRLKAEFSVPERFLSYLKLGQTLELGVAAFPGRRFAGEVYFIAPQVDPAMRTALIRAYVANKELQLKPGMFANLDLALRVRENAITIPEPALMPMGDRITVLVVDKEQTAQLRPVKVGMRTAGQAEIIEGLQPGELVVVEGTQKARPGGKVKLAPPEAAKPYLQQAQTETLQQLR